MDDIETNLLLQSLKGIALGILVAWTIIANALVFVVLYKNRRLQTVPNLLVANLAFSDLCLGTVVLPLSSIYAIAGEWLFSSTLCSIFVSADILCSTASIWNLSIVGLDRYWAITAPTAYIAKRNKKNAVIIILSVWASSALISLAPLLGWKQIAERGNMVQINSTWQCVFLDLPSYTVYSTTGSFFIPLIVLFFVYYKIYQAFGRHRARQIFRRKLLRKHIESTILHELDHVLPEVKNDYERRMLGSSANEDFDEQDEDDYVEGSSSSSKRNDVMESDCGNSSSSCRNTVQLETRIVGGKLGTIETSCLKSATSGSNLKTATVRRTIRASVVNIGKKFSTKKIRSYKERFGNRWRSVDRRPNAISAAKERRGVKVLGIILGCFTICWTPFFIMYVLIQFYPEYTPNHHVEMFITWLGYSNSAMNPIIYTVFNRDYQTGLKNIFRGKKKATNVQSLRHR